jgi:hypothetical protein
MDVMELGQQAAAQLPRDRAWTWLADTTVGAVQLGPLRPVAFTYSQVLNGAGQGSVTLPFDAFQSAIDPSRVLRLWAWRVWAYYNGLPVWGGCPTGVTDTGTLGVPFTLTELPGYLARRQYDVVGGHVYTQVEQTAIAADLAAPVSAVGVTLVTQAGAGFLRDRTYTYLQSDRMAMLQELAGVISGPEFRSEYAVSAGRPTCTLRVAYPRVGSTQTGLGVQVPGAGVDYQAQWDADAMRTHTFAVGDLPDNSPTTAVKPVMVKDVPQSDLPRLDAVDNWSGVVVTSTLTDYANTSAQQHAQPTLVLTATTTVSAPPLGTYGVGDDVTVNLTSPLLPAGYTVTGRLQQLDVDAAAGTAKWTVAVTIPTPKARATITSAIRALTAQQQAMFRKPLTTSPTNL